MSTQSSLLTYLCTDILRDPNNHVWSIATASRALASAYTALQQDLLWLIPSSESSTTFSLTSWTTEYSLPSDRARLEYMTIAVGGVSYRLIRTTKKLIASLNAAYPNSAPWQPYYYYITWSVVWFYPTPITTYTVTAIYNSILPDMSSSQSATIPTWLDDALVAKAAVSCFKQVNKPDLAAYWEQEYVENKDKAFMFLIQDENVRMPLVGNRVYQPSARELTNYPNC